MVGEFQFRNLARGRDKMEDEYAQYVATMLANKDYAEHLTKCIQKIVDAKPPAKDDYTSGISDGLDWAVRILVKDKSAY